MGEVILDKGSKSLKADRTKQERKSQKNQVKNKGALATLSKRQYERCTTEVVITYPDGKKSIKDLTYNIRTKQKKSC